MNSEGFRLSPQQRRLWALGGGVEGFPYRLVARIEYQGRLDGKELERRLRDLAARYEILRTSFRRSSSSSAPVQIISAEPAITVEEHDLGHLASDAQQTGIDSRIREVRQAPIDVARDPLLKLVRFDLGAQHCQLLISAHALCMDRASLEILAEELFDGEVSTDDAGTRGEPLQYVDVAEWQSEWLESEEAAPGREHWRCFDPVNARELVLPSEITPTVGGFDPCRIRLP